MLFQTDIEAEINRLQKQLKDYKSKKEKIEKEMDELDDIIAKIRSKARDIEEGLQETINNIEKKLSRINPKSRFRIRYFEKAKDMLLNSSSSTALQGTREAGRKATDKYLALDDKLSEYRLKISSLESRINTLRQQLQ